MKTFPFSNEILKNSLWTLETCFWSWINFFSNIWSTNCKILRLTWLKTAHTLTINYWPVLRSCFHAIYKMECSELIYSSWPGDFCVPVVCDDENETKQKHVYALKSHVHSKARYCANQKRYTYKYLHVQIFITQASMASSFANHIIFGTPTLTQVSY